MLLIASVLYLFAPLIVSSALAGVVLRFDWCTALRRPIDAGENGRVTLTLQPPNPLFRIEQSGVLITNSPLPPMPAVQQLTVIATDHGTPPLQSSAVVLVSVRMCHSKHDCVD